MLDLLMWLTPLRSPESNGTTEIWVNTLNEITYVFTLIPMWQGF